MPQLAYYLLEILSQTLNLLIGKPVSFRITKIKRFSMENLVIQDRNFIYTRSDAYYKPEHASFLDHLPAKPSKWGGHLELNQKD